MEVDNDSAVLSKKAGGQICQICGDNVGKTVDGELFVACDFCRYPVCRACYGYEMKDGNQSCPQCKNTYKHHKGSPPVYDVEDGDAQETDDLQDYIIICGFGRVGQIIAQLLSECLIPFVALDVRSEREAVGRALDLPVYFGDAGSREVLHKIGAERAAAAAITLDTPGANYRTVWALSKYFPNVKTFVLAHDVDHGVNLEKACATAAKLPTSEIAAMINEFRMRHLSELTEEDSEKSMVATRGTEADHHISARVVVGLLVTSSNSFRN